MSAAGKFAAPTTMATRPENSAEARKAAEWVAGIERKAAEGVLWEETPLLAEQFADHFARLGLSDSTKQYRQRVLRLRRSSRRGT